LRKLFLISIIFALLGCATGEKINPVTTDSGVDTVVDAGSDIMDASADTSVPPPPPLDGSIPANAFDLWSPSTTPISYHGGPILVAPVNVYFIWYGHWSDTKVAPILEDAVAHVDGTAWYQINTGYYQQPILDAGVADAGGLGKILRTNKPGPTDDAGTDSGVTDGSVPDSGTGVKTYATNRINFVESVYVSYTHGTSLSDDDVVQIVSETIASGMLPPDPDGVYFVLASADVSEGSFLSTFCYDFCAWHNNTSILGSNRRIAFVGDTGACDSCNLKKEYLKFGFTNSPNDDWSADSMISALLHELVETVTDPDPSTNVAWQDFNQYENADKCAWTFGQPYITENGSAANMIIGTRHFMVQQNWVLDSTGGHCSLTP
jgi:Phosphate-induced protein 1 conserved region.